MSMRHGACVVLVLDFLGIIQREHYVGWRIVGGTSGIYNGERIGRCTEDVMRERIQIGIGAEEAPLYDYVVSKRGGRRSCNTLLLIKSKGGTINIYD